MSQRLDLQYYEILGLTPSASLEDVEKAYQKACDIYSKNNPEFASSFNEEEAKELKGWVDEAYRNLVEKLKNQTQFLESMITNESSRPTKFQFESEQEDTEQNLSFVEESNQNLFDGLTLKKIRLKKNISLNYISNKTCIGVHHLIAIEANDFASLPAGVFVRSYVKQISQILGLSTKEVAESYMKLYSEARGEV